jgi:hypothetical protein
MPPANNAASFDSSNGAESWNVRVSGQGKIYMLEEWNEYRFDICLLSQVHWLNKELREIWPYVNKVSASASILTMEIISRQSPGCLWPVHNPFQKHGLLNEVFSFLCTGQK